MKFKSLNDVLIKNIRSHSENIRAGFVADTACPKVITYFMDVAGIRDSGEGYGLTETGILFLPY